MKHVSEKIKELLRPFYETADDGRYKPWLSIGEVLSLQYKYNCVGTYSGINITDDDYPYEEGHPTLLLSINDSLEDIKVEEVNVWGCYGVYKTRSRKFPEDVDTFSSCGNSIAVKICKPTGFAREMVSIILEHSPFREMYVKVSESCYIIDGRERDPCHIIHAARWLFEASLIVERPMDILDLSNPKESCLELLFLAMKCRIPSSFGGRAFFRDSRLGLTGEAVTKYKGADLISYGYDPDLIETSLDNYLRGGMSKEEIIEMRRTKI